MSSFAIKTYGHREKATIFNVLRLLNLPNVVWWPKRIPGQSGSSFAAGVRRLPVVVESIRSKLQGVFRKLRVNFGEPHRQNPRTA